MSTALHSLKTKLQTQTGHLFLFLKHFTKQEATQLAVTICCKKQWLLSMKKNDGVFFTYDLNRQHELRSAQEGM